MNGFVLLDTLIWVGSTVLLMVLLSLVACRVKNLHPAIKTWLCRIVLIKALVSLILGSGLPLVRDQQWVTSELMWFLLAMWLVGVLVVAFYAGRSYRATSKLRGSATRLKMDEPIADIEVRQLPGLPEPCVVGVFRQTLLIPANYQVDEAVIYHELAHIKHADTIFGALAWAVHSLFWFIPGLDKLIAEHSLWQEVWADLSSRQRLKLEPGSQARALLSAVSRIRENPVAALGFRGDSKAVARRIEAMFIGRYSRAFGFFVILMACIAALPLELKAGDPGTTLVAESQTLPVFAPIAAPLNVP